MINYKITFVLLHIKDGIGELSMRVKWNSSKNVVGISVGHTITADKWDKESQQCKNNTSHGKKKVAASVINRDIARYRLAAESATTVFLPTYYPTNDEYKAELYRALGKEEKVRSTTPLLQAVVNEFMIKESQLRGWSANTIKKFNTLKDTLKQWRDSATLADLNKKGLEDFYSFLCGKDYTNITIDKYMTTYKQFIKWVDESTDYNIPSDYRAFKPRIKVIAKTVVWLTWDEVMKMHKANLYELAKHKYEDADNEARDIFCLSCFTGLRFSDIHNLRHSDIYDGKIHRGIIKTGEQVTIELNSHAREILERYKGMDEVYAMPRTANPVCNRNIKHIAQALGIDAPTTISYCKGNKIVYETHPKYELITMHTGRRTFICSALERGISPMVVMKWTGHKDYKEMRPYIDISDKAKENAMLLLE